MSDGKALTPAFAQQLQAALLTGFGDRSAIEQLVYFKLGERLNDVGGATLSELTFNLIKWVEAHGRVGELVYAVCTERPENEVVQRLKVQWETVPPSAPPSSPLTPPPPGARYEEAWHVTRPALEERALTYLRNEGRPAVLYAPRKSGRTWLMDRLLDRWKTEFPGGRAIRLSLLAFLPAIGDIDRLVEQIGDAIIDSADGPAAWRVVLHDRGIAPMLRLGRLLTRHVLPSFNGPLLLAFDETDAVLQGNAETSNSFFGGLRSWMDDKGKPLGTCLRLLLAVSTTPARLIRGATISPFNIVPPVDVPPFTQFEAQFLARRSGVGLSEVTLQELINFTGGHPYLTREVLSQAAPDGASGLMLDPRRQAFQNHLKVLLHYVREADLAGPLSQVLAKPTARMDVDAEDRLIRAGILVRDSQDPKRLLSSCGLYDAFFRRALDT